MYLVIRKNISAFSINVYSLYLNANVVHFGLHLDDSVYMIVFCLHILGLLREIGRCIVKQCIVKRDPLTHCFAKCVLRNIQRTSQLINTLHNSKMENHSINYKVICMK